MRNTNPDPGRRHWHIPLIGQRILKTTLAVFLCLISYAILGYRGGNMPTEAAITAIICMQPYVRDTRDFAVNRLAGTVVGSFWGLLLLLLLYFYPALGERLWLLYLLMALGTMLSLHTTVLIRMNDAASLAAIVFLCVVIAFPDVQDPLTQAGLRLGDVLLGTVIAIGVNVVRLPRVKRPNQLFFVKVDDLVPNRFSQIHPTPLFMLNSLYQDGARICFVSEHAPAFFAIQMSAARSKAPAIVMDGAAIYDVQENVYLWQNTINQGDSALVKKHLDAQRVSYFVYTVHKGRTCIFHRGKISPEEHLIYERMRSSPYRSYLEGEVYEAAEIVCFKIIASDERIDELSYALHRDLPAQRYRLVIRPQDEPGISGLYIYNKSACLAHAKEKLLQLVQKDGERLEPVDAVLPYGYHSEYDAIRLLHYIGNRYEPLTIVALLQKLQSKRS